MQGWGGTVVFVSTGRAVVEGTLQRYEADTLSSFSSQPVCREALTDNHMTRSIYERRLRVFSVRQNYPPS